MLIRKLNTGLKKRLPALDRLSKDNSGIAAIEFAFVMPVLIGFYFGMTEVTMGIIADRKVDHATSVTGDLATQLPTLDAVELSDVMTAALAVLEVPSSRINELSIELNSYQMMSDGTVNQVGYARLGPAISAGGPAIYDPSGLSDQLFNAQSGVVVARMNYTYTPTTLFFLDKVTFSETFIMKPRKSISVPFDQGGQTNFTCTAATNLTVSCNPT